jgi:RNA polymerase sigma factor (TIGR02999 family)
MFYDELRRIAGAQLRGERASHTLQATALVNELFFKLRAQNSERSPREQQLQQESDFFGLARYLMRQILIEHARAKQALKRRHVAVPLDDTLHFVQESAPDTERVMEALDRLEKQDPVGRTIIDLRYFCGYSIEETAKALGVGKTKIKEDSRIAALWLQRELRNNDTGKP